MISAVIDTNIFISALLKADTTPRQVLRHCLLGDVITLMSNALYLEYEEIMNRQHLFQSSPANEHEREALFNALLKRCDWINIYYRWRPNLRDEADNHLIELAVAGNAQYLVTGNTRDFRQYELQFPEIKLVTATQFIEMIQE